MADTIGEAFVALRSDDARLQSDIETQLTKALGPVVAKGAKILAGLFVGKQVIGVARSGIAELAEAEKQEALLGAQITATGGAAGITQQHIEDLAQANLQLAGTDDEVTLAAERVLLQFNRITAAGGIFDEALRSAQDLALVNSQELPAATRALGLALQDPIHAARLLQSENIKLNVTQQEQIKQFVASGNILGAQRVILDQVAATVGGVSAKYGDTLAGDLQRAQEELENTKASLLEGAVPAIKLFSQASAAASEEIQGLPTPLRTLAAGALALAGFAPTLLNLRGTLLQSAAAKSTLAAADATGAGSAIAHTAALEANTAALLLNAPALETNVIAAGELVVAEGALVAVAPAVVAAEEEIGVGASAMLGPIGLAVGALTLAVAAFQIFGSGSRSFSVDLKGAIPTVAQFTSEIDALKATNDLGAASFAEQAAAIAKQSIPAARNYNEALRAQGLSTDEVTAAIDKEEEAQRAATAATHGQTLAEYDLTQAQQTRLDAISGLVSAERAAESAARGVTSANRSLADAQRGLARAEQDLANENPAEDRAKAEISLRNAQLNQIDAAKSVAAEEAELARLRSGTSGTTEELRSQEQRLADAREAANRAQRSLAELEREARINGRRGIAQTREQRLAIADAARSAQDAARNTATEEAKLQLLRSPASIAAITEQEQKLEKARLAQQTAVFAVTDAETSLQTVERSGVDAAQDVIDARQRVRDAQNQVSDALTAQIDASAGLSGATDILSGKTETAASKARNLRTAIQGVLDQMAPGSPGRKNLEDEIHLLDLLIGDVNTIASGLQGQGGLSVPPSVLAALAIGITGATGFAGTVTRPTLGLFGEGQGPEDVLAVPHSKGGIQLGSQVTVSVGGVHFHGVVPSAAEAFRTGQAVGAGISDVLTARDVRLARKIA